MAEVKDLMVMKQLVRMLPGDIGVFVIEGQPKTAIEAAKLANDYHLARRGQFEDGEEDSWHEVFKMQLNRPTCTGMPCPTVPASSGWEEDS
uniref:Uncharacterized protein n=1 Tax=Amphimedon queenslandica TaxID=400682 RepID=A0A1X7UPR4_AMPQE